MKYQVFCDRGNGPELDGCWGSENARFDNIIDAEIACRELQSLYPDIDWLVRDLEGSEVYRVKGGQK